jgi:hypothetical protein
MKCFHVLRREIKVFYLKEKKLAELNKSLV